MFQWFHHWDVDSYGNEYMSCDMKRHSGSQLTRRFDHVRPRQHCCLRCSDSQCIRPWPCPPYWWDKGFGLDAGIDQMLSRLIGKIRLCGSYQYCVSNAQTTYLRCVNWWKLGVVEGLYRGEAHHLFKDFICKIWAGSIRTWHRIRLNWQPPVSARSHIIHLTYLSSQSKIQDLKKQGQSLAPILNILERQKEKMFLISTLSAST